MKKIAFMFVAAALVAACGETKKPAEEVEAVVEEVAVATAEDSAAAEALVAECDSTVKDSLFQVALDSIVAAKNAVVEEVAEEEAPATEE